MKKELRIEIEDLIAARDALDSWEDAFQDEEPEQAARVRKISAKFGEVINAMNAENRILRLVDKPEDVH